MVRLEPCDVLTSRGRMARSFTGPISVRLSCNKADAGVRALDGILVSRTVMGLGDEDWPLASASGLTLKVAYRDEVGFSASTRGRA
jgi:hypothetical protein